MKTLKLKRVVARTAAQLGHELGPWQHDLLSFLAVTECRTCGATVRIRDGGIRGDATTVSCRKWPVNGNGAHAPGTA